jgi:hypothetical protein
VLGEEQRLLTAFLEKSRQLSRVNAVVGGEVADAEVHARESMAVGG